MESIVEPHSFYVSNTKMDTIVYDYQGFECPRDYYCSCNGNNTCWADL